MREALEASSHARGSMRVIVSAFEPVLPDQTYSHDRVSSLSSGRRSVHGSSTDIGAVRPSARLEPLFVTVLAVRNGLYNWDPDYIAGGGLLCLHVYEIRRDLYICRSNQRSQRLHRWWACEDMGAHCDIPLAMSPLERY